MIPSCIGDETTKQRSTCIPHKERWPIRRRSTQPKVPSDVEATQMHEAGNVTLPMVLVAVGGTGLLLLARHLALVDPTALGRALRTSLLVISLLGGAVILTGGTDELRIKIAAAVWMTGAVGLATATQFWWLGVVTGIATVIILCMTDRAKT
jgi:hypothetical protein